MAVVATGFFDGVHIGHRLVIDTLVNEARHRGEESVIATLWPHPRIVLGDDAFSLRLLNSLDEKTALLKGLGVDRVEVLPFTREFASLTAEEYLRSYVKEHFGGSALLMGYDNRLGSDRSTPKQTAATAHALGLDVISTDKVLAVGIAVSSTKIRAALSAGDVSLASRFLCYNYTLSGEVVHGKRLGRTIGYPTANIEVAEKLKLIPAAGVYLTETRLGERTFKSMTNISSTVETHIFDFDEDIYGEILNVSFLRRVRDEISFDSLEDLKFQLMKDEINCKKLLLEL